MDKEKEEMNKKRSNFNMTLEHFGKAPLIPFEDEEGEEEPEIVELNPGEEPPSEGEEGSEEVKLSKEEYERLINKTDNNEALRETLEGLRDTINKSPKEQGGQQQQGQPEIDPETFKKQFNEGLFGDDPYKAMQEFIKREVGPYVNQAFQNDAKTNKQLLLVDPEKGKYARKYKDELEGVVQRLPQNQRNNPNVWEYAYEQVMKQHQDDIVNEQVEERVNEILRKKGLLDEEGEGEEGGQRRTKRKREPSSGQSSGQSKSTSKKKKVYVTDEDRRNATERGVTIEDYVRYFK